MFIKSIIVLLVGTIIAIHIKLFVFISSHPRNRLEVLEMSIRIEFLVDFTK